jgi:hypothetical protein
MLGPTLTGEMPSEVNVATDPMLVYGLVGLFIGAVVLALVFARPRRGLGAIKRSDIPDRPGGGEPWMPGGDIFGREPQAPLEPTQPDPDAWPPADPWHVPSTPPPAHDPWSTGATDQPGPEPRWDKR